MKQGTKRIYLLDEIRGFCILAMIVHHAFLDVGVVLKLQWGYDVFNALTVVQPVFWGAFIVISGICSQLSRNSVRRGLIVFAGGMAVTLVTAVIMPALGMAGEEIYFGILHCLGISMIVAGIFKKPIQKTNTFVGMGITAVLFLGTYSVPSGKLFFVLELPRALYQTNWLAPFGFFSGTFHSADYFSLMPWMFLFLFGAFVGKFAAAGQFPKWSYRLRVKALAFVGKNALWFYLAHQVVLYVLFFLIALLIY